MNKRDADSARTRFLSFCFSNVLPISRLGLITTIGIVISLFVILITYAICIDFNLHIIKGKKALNSKIDNLISGFINFQKSKKSLPLIILMSFLCLFGINYFEINNHVNDEFNKSSSLYKEMQFFDKNFGGYKQVSFNIEITDNLELDSVIELENKIKSLGFTIDFSLFGSFKDLKSINKNVQIFEGKYKPLNLKKFDLRKKYLMFCGIGNPHEFEQTLVKYKFNISEKIIFPDHHKFSNIDLKELKSNASRDNLTLVTTEKDFFRLNKTQRKNIKFLKIKLEIKDKEKLKKILISKL